MQLLTIILPTLPLLTTALSVPLLPSTELTTFEKSYISTFPPLPSNNHTARLIGYKKISIPSLELEEFNTHYNTNTIAWQAIPNTFYDRPASVLRVYFPVKDGLVKGKEGVMREAGEEGEIDMGGDLDGVGLGDMIVLGRKQTEDVRGVVGNIVQDGVIWLKEGNKPTHRYGNVFVYDFGIKLVHDHSNDHELKTRDGIEIRKVSCINNHGGPNCSNKFNIHKGRCPFQSRACMDFNGYFTNCKNASPTSFTGVRNFPGSDCDYAMGRGQCWNEIM